MVLFENGTWKGLVGEAKQHFLIYNLSISLINNFRNLFSEKKETKRENSAM